MADGEKKTPREMMLEKAKTLGFDADDLDRLEWAYDSAHNAAGDTPLEEGEEGLEEDRRKLRGQGTETPPMEDAESPYDRATKRHDRVRENRGKKEHARQAYISEIFEAATKGDERVLVRDAPAPFTTTAPSGGGDES